MRMLVLTATCWAEDPGTEPRGENEKEGVKKSVHIRCMFQYKLEKSEPGKKMPDPDGNAAKKLAYIFVK